MGPEIIKDDSSGDGDAEEDEIGHINGTDDGDNGSTVGEQILDTISDHQLKTTPLQSIPETPSRPSSASSFRKKRKRKHRDYDWNTKKRKVMRKSNTR